MYDYLIQDWTTISVNATQGSLTQAESEWISFQPFSDIVFWLEVRGVVVPTGATSVQMQYQTAPARDESLFLDMVTAFDLTVSSTPRVDPVLLSSSPTVPLARWVRWRLVVAGAPEADWGATFRLHAVANSVGPL